LEKLIEHGSGKQLPVVFDFDNTIICGDISEATLATLVKSRLVQAARLPATLCPPFRPPDRPRISLQSCADPTEYYEAFLAPSAHGNADLSPLANGYVWAVEVMEGLRPLDVVNATRTAFKRSQPGQDVFIEVTPGRTAFPVPFFYPEMVELLAALLRHRFDVWIVSAGNVWSIRWLVHHVLNPNLRRLGLDEGVRPDHILGVSTLLADKSDRLYKDEMLVRENAGYAALDERALGAFRLTSRLQFPVPTYSGKLACVFDAIGRSPYLYVGDSPGDHAMLEFSQNRLWIARLEKPTYQQAALELIRKTGRRGWMVQATLTRTVPGFVPDSKEVSLRLGKISPKISQSLRFLACMNRTGFPNPRRQTDD
jgi:phosphoserine phosphatase